MPTAPARKGRDEMEPRLLGLMQTHGVSENNMDKLGDAGVTTISIINCVVIGRKELIEFIEKEPLEIRSGMVMNTIEQA